MGLFDKFKEMPEGQYQCFLESFRTHEKEDKSFIILTWVVEEGEWKGCEIVMFINVDVEAQRNIFEKASAMLWPDIPIPEFGRQATRERVINTVALVRLVYKNVGDKRYKNVFVDELVSGPGSYVKPDVAPTDLNLDEDPFKDDF